MYKSTQSATVLIGATSDTVIIDLDSPVEVDKSYVILEVANLSGGSSAGTVAGDYLFYPQLSHITDGKYTKLTVGRYYLTPGGIQMNIKYTVYELASGSVENGVNSVTSTDMSITISNFSEGHSFSFAYLWADFVSWSGDLQSQIIESRVYNNGANDVIRLRGLNTSSVVDIYWQAITIPEATVNREVVSIPSSTNYDYTFGGTVDTDKLMLFHSFYQSAGSLRQWHFKGGRMLSSTQIRYFSNVAATAEAVSYIVEHPSYFVKDRGTTLWSSQNVAFTLSSSVNQYSGVSHGTLQNNHWSLCDSEPEYSGDFCTRFSFQNLVGDNYTQLRHDRGSVSGTPVVTYWEVLEIALSISEQRRVTKGVGRGVVLGT